jgi:A/G-specific adenine glycosylase
LSDFAARLIRWQSKHGRNDLPWQCRDPYRVWLSEIMLQQTQVATVIPYYERFIERFPDVVSLARADLDDVLRLWSGLGYYSRARNLHAAARDITERRAGRFPRTRAELETLPGVGRSTAAAIAAFAHGEREAILDGNVKRVLARHFAVPGYPGDKGVESRLWKLAESLLPKTKVERYTQALMDLGATLCRRARPDCARCPVRGSCTALQRGSVERFPQARPRKTVPAKHTAMLVLMHRGEVLLEKRPHAGIWGGLWCLPEMPPEASAREHCAHRFGAALVRSSKLPPLQHGFTHFTLNIQPVLCEVRGLNSQVGEPGRLWLPVEDAAQAAVPAPVRKLLLAVNDPPGKERRTKPRSDRVARENAAG